MDTGHPHHHLALSEVTRVTDLDPLFDEFFPRCVVHALDFKHPHFAVSQFDVSVHVADDVAAEFFIGILLPCEAVLFPDSHIRKLLEITDNLVFENVAHPKNPAQTWAWFVIRVAAQTEGQHGITRMPNRAGPDIIAN